MEMQVMIPYSPAVDFNFHSASTTPYISASSTPQRFDNNFFFSAPTTPTRATSLYREFNDFSLIAATTTTTGGSLSTIPFNWEEKPGIPKTKNTQANINIDDTDFEFDFSGQLARTSLSADELFDGGKIKPLKQSPPLQFSQNGLNDSPRAAAIQQTRKQSDEKQEQYSNINEQQRGRERTYNSSASSIKHKGTRSLSPFRVCDLLFDRENNQQSVNSTTTTTTTKHSSSSSSTSSSNWYRKWRLKDFFLFRSASEGRATIKDPLKKYYASLRKISDDLKNSSFRSTDSVGSVSSSRRRGPAVSAHELHYHYTVNRAVSDEMKKKTFLPYNRGLLGCLGFNPAVHEISCRSLTRG